MPNITYPYQQHRCTTGTYLRQQDKKQPTQKSHDERTGMIARHPGSHSGNQSRQSVAQSMISFLSVLSSVQNINIQPAISTARAEDLALENRLRFADSIYTYRSRNKHHSNHRSSSVHRKKNERQQKSSTTPTDSPTLWEKTLDGIYNAAEHILPGDILVFPGAAATPLTPTLPLNESMPSFLNTSTLSEAFPHNFIEAGLKKISLLYDDYASIYKNLRLISRDHISTTLYNTKGVKIDPDTSYLMCFSRNFIEVPTGKHFRIPPVQKSSSLSDWLVFKFNWRPAQRDASCGIFEKSRVKDQIFPDENELPVKASEFFNLFENVDFYSLAKERLSKTFESQNYYVKKHFIDLVIALENSEIHSNYAKDVLKGIGLLDGGASITTSLLDINGYYASNAYIFKNNNLGHITLYVPNCIVKFQSFSSLKEMQHWLVSYCYNRADREDFASHFRLDLRQDGIIYSGVDSLLKKMQHDSQYASVIASAPESISSHDFFNTLYNSMKEKVSADMAVVLTSAPEEQRNRWEAILYELSIIPNPITPFLAFSTNVEHMLTANTYKEKMSEFRKLRANIVNTLCISLLNEVITTAELEGYNFINNVKSKFENNEDYGSPQDDIETENHHSSSDIIGSISIHENSGSLVTKVVNMNTFRTFTLSRHDNFARYFIEDEAYRYLIENGEAASTTPAINVDMGIYLDNNFHLLLNAGDNNFNIIHYDDTGILKIKNTENSAQRVTTLYIFDNNYLLVRAPSNINAPPMITINKCLMKRNPVHSPICYPIRMSPTLDLHLKNAIKKKCYSSKNVVDLDIYPLVNNEEPNTFMDRITGQLYFLHEGHFFKAEWISPQHEDNPTTQYFLRLYSKGTIFRKKPTIAAFAFSKINDEIILQCTEDILSQRLNLPTASVRKFLDEKDLISISNAADIHGALDNAAKAGIYSFPDMVVHKCMRISITAALARNRLYPARIIDDENILIRLTPISEINEDSMASLFISKTKINVAIHDIHEKILPTIINGLEYHESELINYIKEVFGTEDKKFAFAFCLALHQRLEYINDKLDSINIQFAYIDKFNAKTFNQLPANQYADIPTVLDYEEVKAGAIAFVPPDGTNQIIINEDKLHYLFSDYEILHYIDDDVIAQDLTNVLIHELSHLDGVTTDICYFPVEKGQYLPILDSLYYMKENFRNGKVINRKDFDRINSEYFDSVVVYHGIKQKLASDEAASYLMQKDPAYLAHILLNNADAIAIFARDLYRISKT
ncbi:dermonecrotic toxin domain-containing protein [Cedecea davisae]|uniref:dermonecrotic toxin domain-containing protein n=1 Tax=Cedecea davisae TaxID=158484 RepID=UPI0024310A28|nr:DUF6543 domain-containing protein [Cedecea davisae]